LARELRKFAFDLRESLFGVRRRPTHRVLFRIVVDVVEILAVRHVAQDDIELEDL
jgi:hypothetical protein